MYPVDQASTSQTADSSMNNTFAEESCALSPNMSTLDPLPELIR